MGPWRLPALLVPISTNADPFNRSKLSYARISIEIRRTHLHMRVNNSVYLHPIVLVALRLIRIGCPMSHSSPRSQFPKAVHATCSFQFFSTHDPALCIYHLAKLHQALPA